LWGAGYHIEHGDEELAASLLIQAIGHSLEPQVDRDFAETDPHSRYIGLQRDFPLTVSDVATIRDEIQSPERVGSSSLGALARGGSSVGAT
jgi:hypothetical protein